MRWYPACGSARAKALVWLLSNPWAFPRFLLARKNRLHLGFVIRFRFHFDFDSGFLARSPPSIVFEPKSTLVSRRHWRTATVSPLVRAPSLFLRPRPPSSRSFSRPAIPATARRPSAACTVPRPTAIEAAADCAEPRTEPALHKSSIMPSHLVEYNEMSEVSNRSRGGRGGRGGGGLADVSPRDFFD